MQKAIAIALLAMLTGCATQPLTVPPTADNAATSFQTKKTSGQGPYGFTSVQGPCA